MKKNISKYLNSFLVPIGLMMLFFSCEESTNLIYYDKNAPAPMLIDKSTISVENEAGKSTLHTFIKGMLFGIERQRGRASKNDTYSKFQPWTQSGVYEGYLRVECDGQIYRIERRFQKGDKRLCVINETTGKEEENNKLIDYKYSIL